MTPFPFPLELHHDGEHQDHHHFLAPNLQSSFSYPIFFNPSEDQELQQVDKFNWHGKSYDHQIMELENETSLKHAIWKTGNGNENEKQCENNSNNWISSKMSMMGELTSSNSIMGKDYSNNSVQKQQALSPSETDNSSNSSLSNTIRVCSDCCTTKTPLWRSGPKGPKSLCNACGIRQRKARRAAALSAAGTIAAADTKTVKKKMQHKNKKSMNSQLPLKKKCKLIVTSGAGASPAATSGCERVFPQELKEAAILLMALSCALFHG